MKTKHVVPVAILFLALLLTAIIVVVGCARSSDPVAPFDIQMPKVATLTTPGAPENACVYDDTVYVADNEAGVAKIALLPSPHYVSEYRPGSDVSNDSHGFVWVGYDSVKHTVTATDRDNTYNTGHPAELNRLMGRLYDAQGDSMATWAEVRNSGSTCIFHDPDTTLHVMKCHILGDGFFVYTRVWVDDGNGGFYLSLQGPPGYNPPTKSVVRQAVIDKPYAYAAAEDYGFISLRTGNYNTTPVELGHVDLPGYANWVAKRDTVCYVATKYSGIGVVSVADPTHPRLIRVVALPSSDEQYQLEVSADGTRLFLVDNLDGVYVFGLSDPGNPQYLGLLPILRPVAITCYQHYLLVCSEAEGLVIYQI